MTIAGQFQSRDDWTGLTPKELRMALDEAILLSCYANVPPAQHADCLACHESEIDFAIYSMVSAAFPRNDEPSMPLEQVSAAHGNKAFDSYGKQNCLEGYTNTYFYRYIHDVELCNLARIVESNKQMALENAVDYYITGILYPDIVDANPGMFITYRTVCNVPSARVRSLTRISCDIQRAYRSNNQVELFKNAFFLMTDFAETKYRAVHRGVMALFNADMAAYREMFYRNVPGIIAREGAIATGRVTP